MREDRVQTELNNRYTEHAKEANFIREVILEREQLYAVSVHLLALLGIDTLLITDSDLKDFRNKQLIMTPDFENNTLGLQVVLLEKEDGV